MPRCVLNRVAKLELRRDSAREKKGAAYDSGILAVLITHECTGHNRDMSFINGR
jgi:hypothetical protein